MIDRNDEVKNEIIHQWNYFCSICSKLENTRQYVEHSNEDHLSVYSLEFQQILILASMEFENLSKRLCVIINSKFNLKSNIIEISKTVLDKYPRIVETIIYTDYRTMKPLKEWKIGKNADGKEIVKGIDWWDDYNLVKHQGFINYSHATLKNAINSVAALMVIELYLIYIRYGTINLKKQCDYFDTGYFSKGLITEEGRLPDFRLDN